MRQQQTRLFRTSRTLSQPAAQIPQTKSAGSSQACVSHDAPPATSPATQRKRAQHLSHSLADIALQKPAERATQNDASPQAIQQAAAQGRGTPTTSLPHAHHLQQAFGHHSIHNIQAHLNPRARASAQAMQATAFASGEHIVFANTPDVHTVAHEAAHVVQQRAGVRLPTHVGTEEDRYEQQAEAVAKRVAAGRSAQDLLDRLSPQSSERPTHQPEQQGQVSHRPSLTDSSPSPVHRMAVQRLRSGFAEETKPLTEDEEQAQLKLFTDPTSQSKGKSKQLVELSTKDVESKYVKQLNDDLIRLAQKANNKYDEKAAEYQGTSGNDLEKTPYYALLAQAIDKVLGMYASVLKEALVEAKGKGAGPLAQVANTPDDKSPIGMKRPDQLYKDFPKEEMKSETREAIQYQMKNNFTIKQTLATIRQHHREKKGKQIDAQTLQEVYTEALLTQENVGKLTDELVRLRLRWSPQTRGSIVYFEPEGKTEKVGAWIIYKQLVHEALHTAAHRDFEAYLNTLSAELRDTINEGTVDYFANKVWRQVAAALVADTSNPEITTVHGITNPPEPKADELPKDDVVVLQKYASEYLYKSQVPVIEKAITKLGSSGEDRLKAAYFYGDVNHFFPSYAEEGPEAMDEEKKIEIKEGSGNLEGPIEEEDPEKTASKRRRNKREVESDEEQELKESASKKGFNKREVESDEDEEPKKTTTRRSTRKSKTKDEKYVKK
jgi:Domain of unknown function (DUF4157)